MKLPKSTVRGRRRTVLFRSIVIALCSATVISTVQCNPTGVSEQPSAVIAAKQPSPVSSEGATEAAASAAAATKQDKSQPEAKSSPAETAKSNDQSATATSAAESSLAAEQTRKGRSEAPPVAPSEPVAKPSSQPAESGKSSTNKPAAEQKPVANKLAAANSSASSQSKQQQLAGKSGLPSSSSSKKLPANLGTVTSTGSGGPAHYMSKHDAYSAIAEKHGALAQDAMRKADKRNHNLQRFSGIQKASGFTDALNPFKSVTDGGLARTLGASMRSIMKGKYSIPAYVASAVLGAVALMAFYESPISPLPVPALPEPPVGRFPPEMPVISPNLQVPFRMNQQQQQYGQQYGQQNGYANQRSFQTGGNSPLGPIQQQQQQQQQQQPSQQVLFPGATAQAAQQRQGSASPGPIQQLAANLISSVGANKQTAQRKSGSDPDSASSRSFFGSSSHLNVNKLSAPANQQQPKQPGSSLLSFLGFGAGSSTGPGQTSGVPSSQVALAGLGDVHRASGPSSHSMSSGTGHELGASLSNSHLVNKMKSYFDRPVPHNSWSMDHNVPNQYDQYRRMSIMQALAKDTAFLSAFFSPSRRSSNVTSQASPIQQSISAMLSGTGGPSSTGVSPVVTPQVASSRMQTDSAAVMPSLMSSLPFSPALAIASTGGQPAASVPKRASSGFGLMRAADRVAHALLDTFTSAGMMHRSSAGAESASSRRALEEQQQQQNALVSATSILSDIMSSYNAASQVSAELNTGGQQQQQAQAAEVATPAANKQQPIGPEQASGRSGAADSTSQTDNKPVGGGEQTAAAIAPQQAKPAGGQSASAAPEQQQASSQQPLSRKVRSIGLDYPMMEQTQQQQPSRASQINNLVDFVSDSYKQNKLLFSFVMNQVGLSRALPYVEQLLDNPNDSKGHLFS